MVLYSIISPRRTRLLKGRDSESTHSAAKLMRDARGWRQKSLIILGLPSEAANNSFKPTPLHGAAYFRR